MRAILNAPKPFCIFGTALRTSLHVPRSLEPRECIRFEFSAATALDAIHTRHRFSLPRFKINLPRISVLSYLQPWHFQPSNPEKRIVADAESARTSAKSQIALFQMLKPEFQRRPKLSFNSQFTPRSARRIRPYPMKGNSTIGLTNDKRQH